MENNYIKLDWDLVEKIYIDKEKMLKNVAYKRVQNIEVAEDIVQNTMESILIVGLYDETVGKKQSNMKVFSEQCLDIWDEMFEK